MRKDRPIEVVNSCNILTPPRRLIWTYKMLFIIRLRVKRGLRRNQRNRVILWQCISISIWPPRIHWLIMWRLRLKLRRRKRVWFRIGKIWRRERRKRKLFRRLIFKKYYKKLTRKKYRKISQKKIYSPSQGLSQKRKNH
jgi:hypothetical protein